MSAYDMEDEAAKKLLHAIQTATVRYATWSTLTARPKQQGRPYPNETPDFKEGRALRDYQVRLASLSAGLNPRQSHPHSPP
jgi:hypothetical protein